MRDLPDTRAEVAFVGRSNAGKSSAINTLANPPGWLMSRKPWPHPAHQFFDLGHERFLVDLPGYGYAEVPEAVRAHWVELLGRYLGERSSLIGLLLIMDARHPLKDLDRRMLDYFTPPAGRCIFYCPKPTNSAARNKPPPCARSRPNWPNTATPSACSCSPA